MRTIPAEKITEAVKEIAMLANYDLPADVLATLKKARENEESPVGQEILDQILENAAIAASERVPICQDTGFAAIFIEIGHEVCIEGDLPAAVDEGVRQGYTEGYLRKSIVSDPLRRTNTGDNTPAALTVEFVPGDQVTVTIAPKGGGSENMSMARLFAPAAGRDGLIDFIVNRVKESGSNPCPPVVVGVGIGGTFDLSARLAKKALMRDLGQRHPDPFYAEMEEEILEKVNNLGIGPMGLGGRTTALDVHIEFYPCHIASLPVAVNMQCHAARHKSVTL
jgi:fumarate hydratase subunit alpha